MEDLVLNGEVSTWRVRDERSEWTSKRRSRQSSSWCCCCCSWTLTTLCLSPISLAGIDIFLGFTDFKNLPLLFDKSFSGFLSDDFDAIETWWDCFISLLILINKQRNRYSISHRQIRVLRIDVFFFQGWRLRWRLVWRVLKFKSQR